MRPMRILLQLLLLSAITLLGEAVSYLLPFTFPGTLIAMFILLALMGTGIIRESHLEESSAFFTRYMALFFVPYGVGLMVSYRVILENLWAILVSGIVSTVLVIFVTGKTFQSLNRRARLRQIKHLRHAE